MIFHSKLFFTFLWFYVNYFDIKTYWKLKKAFHLMIQIKYSNIKNSGIVLPKLVKNWDQEKTYLSFFRDLQSPFMPFVGELLRIARSTLLSDTLIQRMRLQGANKKNYTTIYSVVLSTMFVAGQRCMATLSR